MEKIMSAVSAVFSPTGAVVILALIPVLAVLSIWCNKRDMKKDQSSKQ